MEISMNTDWECYEAFLAGNIEGFEQLVLRYKNPLIYFLCRYVEDVMTAEDLAQDAFVEVYVHKDRFDKEKNFKTSEHMDTEVDRWGDSRQFKCSYRCQFCPNV